MARISILPSKNTELEIDIFSNKSSLTLFWLLCSYNQIRKQGFSINELARVTGNSIGLVYKVVKQLEYEGIVISKGLRTKKIFYLKSPEKILISWINNYNLVKKTKVKGFSATDMGDFNFKKNGLFPALHTAAKELFKVKSTNLKSKEFYLKDWEMLNQVMVNLDLQEMDRGYDILLVKPYYSSLIKKLKYIDDDSIWKKSYNLLVILDLCHFPLRGVEQAEVLFRKTDFLKEICQWSEVENAIG